jgi:hypothetical protein
MGFNELYQAMQTGVVDGAGEQRAHGARAEPLPGQQGVQPDRAPDHSRDLRVLEAHVGRCSKADQALLRKVSREAQMEQRSCGTR